MSPEAVLCVTTPGHPDFFFLQDLEVVYTCASLFSSFLCCPSRFGGIHVRFRMGMTFDFGWFHMCRYERVFISLVGAGVGVDEWPHQFSKILFSSEN